MPRPSHPKSRRAGRRALTLFFGAVGVFFLATQIFESRDAVHVAERRLAAKLQGNEQVGKNAAAGRFVAAPKAEVNKLRKLRRSLYVYMGAGAASLLIVLLIALTGTQLALMAAALVVIAIASWWLTDDIAPVLPLVLAGLLAQIPDDVWNPPREAP